MCKNVQRAYMDKYYTGSPAGFEIDRTAARHANKAWQAVVVLFLDKLIDSILGGLDHL